MDLTPDGPFGELDQDKNTLPTETVDALHHGSIGSDQAGNPAEGLNLKNRPSPSKEAFGAQFARIAARVLRQIVSACWLASRSTADGELCNRQQRRGAHLQ